MTDHRDNTSSIHEKLDADTLSTLEHAVVNRTPPTFTACYEKFGLAESGLSYSAFYRYARRLRDAARLTHVAELKGEDAVSATAAIPHLVANQLVDALTVENPSSRTVARLASAYRHFVSAQVARRRLDFAEMDHKETERSREIAEITDAYIRINKLKLADIQGDLALQQVAATAPLTEPRPSESGPSEPKCGTGLPTGHQNSVRLQSTPSARTEGRLKSAVSTPAAYSLQSAAYLDSRIDAAIEARLPPSLRPDPSRRHDPSNGKKKKHRSLAPT
jgi:hypothetical protein